MKLWLSRNILPNINTCGNGWSNFSANLRVVSLKLLNSHDQMYQFTSISYVPNIIARNIINTGKMWFRWSLWFVGPTKYQFINVGVNIFFSVYNYCGLATYILALYFCTFIIYGIFRRQKRSKQLRPINDICTVFVSF